MDYTVNNWEDGTLEGYFSSFQEARTYVVDNELNAVICGHGSITRINADLTSEFVD